jgi:hypothetical protein
MKEFAMPVLLTLLVLVVLVMVGDATWRSDVLLNTVD